MQSSQRKHTSSDAKQNGTQRSTEKSVLTHTHKKKARWRGEKVGPMNKGSFWSSQLVLPIFPLSLTPLLLLSHTPSLHTHSHSTLSLHTHSLTPHTHSFTLCFLSLCGLIWRAHKPGIQLSNVGARNRHIHALVLGLACRFSSSLCLPLPSLAFLTRGRLIAEK